MDISMELGIVQAVVGLVILIVIGPVAQIITLKVSFNGLREDIKEGRGDIKEIRTDVKGLVASTAQQNTDIAVHDQRIVSLESRVKKVEG